MIFNDKALVRQMKQAHRGGGVKVYRYDLDHTDSLMIDAGFWAIATGMSELPRKVLGQLAEYYGRIPLFGDAVWLIEGEEPAELDAVALASMRVLFDPQLYGVDMVDTHIDLQGARLFLRRDGAMLPLDLGLLDMLCKRRNLGMCNGDGVTLFTDLDSTQAVVIYPTAAISDQQTLLGHIAAFDFWGCR